MGAERIEAQLPLGRFDVAIVGLIHHGRLPCGTAVLGLFEQSKFPHNRSSLHICPVVGLREPSQESMGGIGNSALHWDWAR